jgi:MFS transporter, DHA2 family, multidrug resistance protein
VSAAEPQAAVSPAAVKDKASFADWLAVMAGTLGAMMALMDVSIVNSSLPVIQGEIGATPSEATWVGTSYLVAEIVVIPLCAWLERLLGLRRLLLGGAALFTVFSVLCGFATSLEMMILGRIGQGFCGGVLIPTALTMVATLLPPRQQAIGLALTAMSALLGPSIGPVLGGWLTENYGWRYAFFINVPICMAQAAMLLIGVRKTRGDIRELHNADWMGIGGMIVGLGAITTLLEKGHREQWFDSTLIWQLAIAACIGFGMIAWGQRRAVRPVIRLSLLNNRGLASAVALLGGVGMLLYTGMFVTPQFLVTVSGYNAQQAGMIAFISGIVAIPAAFVYPLFAARLDVRINIAIAIALVVVGNYLLTGLSVLSAGRDFIVAQLLYGIGTTWSAMPLQQAVFSAVPVEDTAEANSLSAVARNLGGSIGLAALSSFQDQRFELHRWETHASLSANDPEWQQQIAQAAGQFGGGGEGWEAAFHALDGQVMQQSLVMSFNDIYLALGVVGLISMPLVLLLRPAPKGASMMAMH